MQGTRDGWTQSDQTPIDLDDLHFDQSRTIYQARWRHGDIQTIANLQAIENQPACGFRLKAWSCRSDGVPLSQKLEQRGANWAEELKYRFAQALKQANWIAENDHQENTWHHKSQITQTRRSVRVLSVPARSGFAAYERTITAQDVTFACSRCEKQVTRSVYPGAKPLYCDDCAPVVRREQTRARVARLRLQRKVNR